MEDDTHSANRDVRNRSRTSVFPEEQTPITINRSLDSLHKSLSIANKMARSRTFMKCTTVPEYDSDSHFRDEIKKQKKNVQYLKGRLEESVKMDRADRVEQLCLLIMESGDSLCDDKWLGWKYGEPILALAVAYDSTAAAETLIRYGGQCLVCKEFKTSDFHCLTALHLAIIKGNHDIVKPMLCVLDDDQKRNLLNKKQGYRRWSFASHPLSLAITTGNLRVLGLLLEHDANLLIKDPVTGNTLLHTLADLGVKSPKRSVEMLFWILQSEETELWWSRRRAEEERCCHLAEAMLKERNDDGFTPMSYAVLVHSTEFAAAVLSVSPVYTLPSLDVNPVADQWLEISEVDPALGGSKSSAFCLLEMFTYSMSDRVLTLGEMPHVNRVVRDKWLGYRQRFFAWLALHLCVMVAFTTFTTVGRLHPAVRRLVGHSRPNETAVAVATNLDHFCLGLELFVFVVAAAYAVLDVADAVRIARRHRLWEIGSRLKFKYHLIIVLNHIDLFTLPVSLFAFSALTTSVLRLLDYQLADAFSTLAAICGWMFLLFFIRVMKDLGIFTAIVHRIIFRELTNVTVLILIVVLSYAVGFLALFPNKPTEVRTLQETYFRLIKVTLGLEEFDILDGAKLPTLAKLLFLGFMLLSQILLLNVLIAAMNTTYTRLAELNDAIRIHVLSGIVLFMERRTPTFLLPENDYVQLDEAEDDRRYIRCKVTEEDKLWQYSGLKPTVDVSAQTNPLAS